MAFFSKENKNRETRTSSRARIPLKTYYRSETEKDKASPFKKKKATTKARRFLFGFLDIALLVILSSCLLYSLIVSSRPRVIISSKAYSSMTAYQQEAEKLFSSLKNRNKITFDQNYISQGMKSRFPEIDSVDTELPIFSQKATLRLNIALPSLILKSKNATYIVDSKGTIVKRLDKLTANKLPILEDNSGYEAKIGNPVLNSEAVKFIKTLNAELVRAQIEVAGYTLPPVAQEIDLMVKGQGYFVKFYLGGEALTQTGQYLAARNHFNQSEIPQQYLDVRVPGKIFYK